MEQFDDPMARSAPYARRHARALFFSVFFFKIDLPIHLRNSILPNDFHINLGKELKGKDQKIQKYIFLMKNKGGLGVGLESKMQPSNTKM